MTNIEIKKMIDLFEWFVKYKEKNMTDSLFRELHPTTQYIVKKQQFQKISDSKQKFKHDSVEEYLDLKIQLIMRWFGN